MGNHSPLPHGELTRERLRELGFDSIHQSRNLGKADVSRLEWPPLSGQWVVVKDLRARPLWYRVLWGRSNQKREWKTLQALNGIEGIPRPIAWLDADAFAIEWRPGKPASQWDKRTIPIAALEEAARILEAAHARGVTHGDLHSHNILVSEDGQVTLLDWATGSIFGAHPRGFKRVTFNEWQALDQRAIAKLKMRHAPHIVTPHEQQVLTHGSPLSGMVRNVGFYFRRLFGIRTGKTPKEASERFARKLEKQALLTQERAQQEAKQRTTGEGDRS